MTRAPLDPGPTIVAWRLFWRGVPRKVSYLRGGRRAWLMTLPTAAPPVNTSSLKQEHKPHPSLRGRTGELELAASRASLTLCRPLQCAKLAAVCRRSERRERNEEGVRWALPLPGGTASCLCARCVESGRF